jgi:hypothetical protein
VVSLDTKSIKLIQARAKATQAIEQHIAPGYEADLASHSIHSFYIFMVYFMNAVHAVCLAVYMCA